MKFFSFTQLSWISSFTLFMYINMGWVLCWTFNIYSATGICSGPLCYAVVCCFSCVFSNFLPSPQHMRIHLRFPHCVYVLINAQKLPLCSHFLHSWLHYITLGEATWNTNQQRTHTYIEPSGKLWWNPFIMLQPTMKNICNQLWQLFCKNGQ